MADTALADLSALTAVNAETTDLLYVVVDPGGTPADRKMTLGELVDFFGDVFSVTITVVKEKDYTMPGNHGTGTGSLRMRFSEDVDIVSITPHCSTAPSGGAAVYDVNRSGTTIFTTQANRPSISSGQNLGSAAEPDVVAVDTDQWLTFDCDTANGVQGSVLTVAYQKRAA